MLMADVELDDLSRQRILTHDEEKGRGEAKGDGAMTAAEKWRNAQCLAASFCACLAMVLAIVLVLVVGHKGAQETDAAAAGQIGNGLTYDAFSAVHMASPDCSWLDSGRGLVCIESDAVVFRAASDAAQTSEFLGPELAEETDDIMPSHDGRYAVLASNVESVFRHSRTFTATLFDADSGRTALLAEDVQAVAWNPASTRENVLAFVRGGNVHIATWDDDDVNTVVVTSDAAQGQVLNGIHSWVYEEEIFGQSDALWWSEDGSLLAYVRTDESAVPEMDLGFYGPTAGVPPPADDQLPDDLVEGDYLYPRTRPLKYPKAGMTNPDLELRFFDLDASGGGAIRAWTAGDADEDGTDSELDVLATVVWGEGDRLMTRWCDRVQNACKLRVRSVRAAGTPPDEVQRATDRAGSGWIERHEAYGMAYAGFYYGVDDSESHVDVFIGSGAEWAGTATCSTSTAGILAQAFVGATTDGTFYVVAHPHDMPWIKRLYRVTCDDGGDARAELVDVDGPDVDDGADWVTASMAPAARADALVLVTAQSPTRVPRHALVHAASAAADVVLEDNGAAAAAIDALGTPLPTVTFEMVDIGNEEPVAVMTARAQSSQTLGALFHVYGGPGSQTAEAKFHWDWSLWVAMSARAHLVVVDGRGTGGRGTAYQHLVHRQLGVLESEDQIAAARVIGARDFVDETRLFIWGWSYGGFMTLMTLARDNGDVFRSGMAVAPVTDWRSYDSLYTERYQGLPDDNADGYTASSVLNKVDQIAVPLVLMHGTGDDNVHLSNSMMFLNQAIRADVHVKLMVYPDRNHGIYGGNTRAYLYDELTAHLDGLVADAR